MIEKSIFIEDLVELFPPSVGLLSKYGIRCLRCGEPSWGTLESAAYEKGIPEERFIEILDELNVLFKQYKPGL